VSCSNEGASEKQIDWYQYEGGGSPLSLENQYLRLDFEPATAGITLTDKSTGSTWRSSPLDAATDAGSDAVTRYLMQSQFSVLYGDNLGTGQTLSSFRYSIDRGTYSFAKVDNAIEVYYTVGNVERQFYFPIALPEARMDYFLELMSSSSKSRIKGAFRLIKLDNLRPSDDRAALIQSYPDLEEGPVYVLRDTTQAFLKAQIETDFEEAGYTMDDFLSDSERYEVAEDERPVFSLTLRYELDANSLLVIIPFDSISYRTSYPITQLNMMPFFGAGNKEDEGYLFVPDGSGALINFNNDKVSQNAYSNRVYGWDMATSRTAMASDNKAPIPVFGIQKNGEALLCVIEEGASYATIQADVSGRNSSYNRVFASYTMIHSALMNITGRSDRNVLNYEAKLPESERIVQRFIPCPEDTYVGMAHTYRDYLLEKNPTLANKSEIPEVPIAIEMIGAISTTQHRLGIPFDLPLSLSTFSQMQTMLSDFSEAGWEKPFVKISGAFNGGVRHKIPNSVNLISQLGGKSQFTKLLSQAETQGAEIFLEGNTTVVYETSLFDGFSQDRDASRFVSRERVIITPYSITWFGQDRSDPNRAYLARPVYQMGLIDKFTSSAAKLGVTGYAFRLIGNTLGADYNEKRLVSREATMNMQVDKLKSLTEAGNSLMLGGGFAYAMPYADIITDMALTDQHFGITDAAVPFYQIALHGLIPYTGKALNLVEDYRLSLLDTIASGAGLYFSFMYESPSILQETDYREYYANEYSKWIDDARAIYSEFSSAFGHLANQAITNHQIVAPSVSITTYEDGTRVFVNRSAENYRTDSGYIMEAYTYRVEK
jgi:hypothetical protein